MREMNAEDLAEFSDPVGPWARWQLRRAREAAHRKGSSTEREVLVHRLLLGGRDRMYFPPGEGLGNAYRRLYEMLTSLPPTELAPMAAPAWTPEHDRAQAWVKGAVTEEYEFAKAGGFPFPALLLCGHVIVNARRLFPGVDVDSLVFEEGLNHDPLPDRDPLDALAQEVEGATRAAELKHRT